MRKLDCRDLLAEESAQLMPARIAGDIDLQEILGPVLEVAADLFVVPEIGAFGRPWIECLHGLDAIGTLVEAGLPRSPLGTLPEQRCQAGQPLTGISHGQDEAAAGELPVEQRIDQGGREIGERMAAVKESVAPDEIGLHMLGLCEHARWIVVLDAIAENPQALGQSGRSCPAEAETEYLVSAGPSQWPEHVSES